MYLHPLVDTWGILYVVTSSWIRKYRLIQKFKYDKNTVPLDRYMSD